MQGIIEADELGVNVHPSPKKAHVLDGTLDSQKVLLFGEIGNLWEVETN